MFIRKTGWNQWFEADLSGMKWLKTTGCMIGMSGNCAEQNGCSADAGAVIPDF